MSKSGPIVILEDDQDDRNFMEKIFALLEIENERVYFEKDTQVLEYLSSTPKSIFIIFSDVNLSGRSGLELKKAIDDDPILRLKSIPFIFYSTSTRHEQIVEAYSKLTIQGFFKKDDNLADAKLAMATILAYWRLSKHPNM